MFKLLLTLTCFLTLSLKAELKLYLDFTLNDKDALLQLDEALRVGNELRNALKILKDSPDKQKEFKDLESKLKTYEDEMLKVYGIYPGLNYKMIPTSGYIFNLVPESKREEYLEKGFKIPADAPTVIIKDKDKQDVKCLKIKIKLLQKRESVMQFDQALKTAQSIRQQIRSLEKQLFNKPELKEKESIKEGMAKLKEALKDIELKMNENFGVRNDGKYIFEPKTGAVYLALDKEDLKKLSDLKKAREK